MNTLVILCLFAAEGSLSLIPNDAVEVKIWHQPELSGLYYVTDDTALNIPLIGVVPVANLGVDSLEAVLARKVQDYYGDIFLNINFFYRISVFGEVMKPGAYYLKHGDNLANLLAEAGGPSQYANTSKIRILNRGTERRLNYEGVIKRGREMEKLDLRPGDVVIVPRRFMPAFQEWGVLFTLGTLLLQIYIAVND